MTHGGTRSDIRRMRYVLGVVFLLGCGGVKYNSSTTKGEGCADVAEAFCGRLIQCGVVSQAEKGPCLEGFQGGCCADDRRCGELIANPAGAANCVNELPRADCAQFRPVIAVPAFCAQMF